MIEQTPLPPGEAAFFSFAGVFCFAVRPCRFVSAMICRQIPSDCASIRGRVHGDLLTMILLVAHGFYLLAGILPAYFLARNTGHIWRNLFAWLGGFLLQVGAVAATFLIVVLANTEAAPLAIAMALVPPLPLLLVTPCLGLAAAQTQRYIKTRRPSLSVD
jgi:hypothetical protein